MAKRLLNTTDREALERFIDESSLGTVYDEFPSQDIIAEMPNNSYFTVKFYKWIDRGDYKNQYTDTSLVTYYRTTNWRPDAIRCKISDSQTIYVVPMNQESGDIFLTYYGIKQGKENAENNSTIIESLLGDWDVSYGSTFRFPIGHFYFARPIDASKKQISIIGTVNGAFRHDKQNGTTWLHFESLSDGETALTVQQCTIADFTIAGSTEQYNLELNRYDTTDTTQKSILNGDKPEIIETASVEAYGIKTNGQMIIRDIGVINFYYGIWCENSNANITNVAFNSCHYGLSVGTDIKISNLFGFNLMTLLQLRGSLASATGVRGDSIGNHLVEITGGGNHTLTDLDADFCMNSIVAIGDGVNVSNVSDLIINGVHGRSGVSHVYNVNEDEEINAADITADTSNEYGVVSISAGSSLKGAVITTNQRFGSNSPFDNVSGYCVPYVLLSAGEATIAEDIHFVCSAYNINDDSIDKDWLAKRVASVSSYENACSAKVDTSKGYIKYTKRNGIVTITDDASDIYNRMDKSNLALDGEVVKTINGLYPDEDGNINVVQEEPIFVNSIEECADTSKRYVLPDGYIYTYRKKFVAASTTPNFTNQLPLALNPLNTNEVLNGVGYGEEGIRYGYNDNREFEESTIPTFTTHRSTGLIPIPVPTEENPVTIRINKVGYHTGCGSSAPLITFYGSESRYVKTLFGGSSSNMQLIIDAGGKYTLTGSYGDAVWSDIEIPVTEITADWVAKEIEYFSVIFSPKISPEDIIITVNEEITYTVTEDHYEYSWESTGELYEKPDYLTMINKLDDRIAALEAQFNTGGDA